MSAETTPAPVLRILRLEIRSEEDLILVRQRVRQISQALGFETTVQTRIATALSEVARNAFQYAGGGTVHFAVENENRAAAPGKPLRQSLRLTVTDHGPGIPERVLESGASPSATGLGLGLAGARRLMDRMDVQTASTGSVVTMHKVLPGGPVLRTPAELQRLLDKISRLPAASPADEMEVQNKELLRTLDELTRVNQELTETNAGVLALYDELETLNRVGLILAQRHHLHDLLQTIIDATTELTGAQLGAFYYHEARTATWRLQATAGSREGAVAAVPPDHPAGFFGEDVNPRVRRRLGDPLTPGGTCSCERWVDALAGVFPVRSCLYVPVLMANTELAGALVFGHGDENAFTERAERIVSAVAVQAALGIEKARLFEGLRTASEAKDRFLAMLSHELRTPLNPVTAILSSLTNDPLLPEHLREDVAVMRRNIDLESRLIDDLLDFNRIIRGKLELQKAPVDLHTLIKAVVEICEPEVRDAGHTLTLDLQADRAVVQGDSARLQQVLWNLLKNAIKFTPRGGAIAVGTSLDAENGSLRIEVSDTGCGIAPEVLPLIFSAFDQGALPHGGRGGLGLGLAIARSFLELHGGRIVAISEGRGKGSRFVLHLPLLPTSHAASAPAVAVPAAPANAASRRILLVDDHPDTLRTLARLLMRRGHVVTTAATCAEALEIASRESFQIVVSDVGLPDRSGLELVAELHRTQAIPAIALSGYGMESDLVNSHSAGFDRHLTKPVDFPLLEQSINELCERNSAQARR